MLNGAPPDGSVPVRVRVTPETGGSPAVLVPFPSLSTYTAPLMVVLTSSMKLLFGEIEPAPITMLLIADGSSLTVPGVCVPVPPATGPGMVLPLVVPGGWVGSITV